MRPLAPTTYLLRNAGKTIPLIGVIVLAVLLVCGIISLINSIPLSIRVIYAYNKEFLGVSPRGDPTQTQKIVQEITSQSPVPVERVMIVRGTSNQVQSIVGKWPFVVVGMAQGDMEWYLRRQMSKGIQGRLPTPGAPEALITKPVAKNLKLRIGSSLLHPDTNESYSPKPVKVVGIADTDRWLMFTSIEYQRENHFPPIDLAMIFAKNVQQQEVLDHWAEDHFKGKRAQLWAFHQIEKNTREMFATLYQILNVVIGTLALVITIMMGMLMNIYQSQRLVEFGLLQAIGYTKKQLLRRVLIESVLVVIAGWVIGMVAGYGLLILAQRVMMEPKSFALNPLDPVAFAYSVPIPFAILLVAIATVVLRFRSFDPVGIVERRLV
jgi:ABC-type lipoprotein release transport system permease subunit